MIKSKNGTEINLESPKKHSRQLPSVPIAAPSPITTGRRTGSVRIESEEDKRERQARFQEKKDTAERMHKAAEEIEGQRFEEAEQKDKEEALRAHEERHRLVERLKEVMASSDLESEEGEVIEKAGVSEQPVNGANKSLEQESHRIDTSKSARRRRSPLDINATKKYTPPPLSTLMTARNIDRLDEIEYPQGIKSPKTELNQNAAKDGKFRYDRDFLLQFMQVCKEKPPHLPALDILGLEPVDQTSCTMTRGGSGRHRQALAGVSVSGARSASIGLVVGGDFKPSALPNPFQMSQFSTPPGTKLTSEERFLIPSGACSASVGSDPVAAELLNHPTMVPTLGQGGPGRPVGSKRTRSKRKVKRNNAGKSALGQQGHVSGYGSAAV